MALFGRNPAPVVPCLISALPPHRFDLWNFSNMVLGMI